MKKYLLVFLLIAICIATIGCEQAKSVQKPQAGDESDAKVAMEAESPLLLDDEPLLLLDDEPEADDEPDTEVVKEEEPPLLLDDEPLLLLDDEPEANESDGPQADNSRCFVCHINYMQEDIAVVHARANIGCAGCHGESDEHIADESWASGGNGTAPEIMYPRPKINPFCMGCHTKDKIDTEQHKPLFANFEKMVCTDCHGEHRIITPRKCKWK